MPCSMPQKLVIFLLLTLILNLTLTLTLTLPYTQHPLVSSGYDKCLTNRDPDPKIRHLLWCTVTIMGPRGVAERLGLGLGLGLVRK